MAFFGSEFIDVLRELGRAPGLGAEVVFDATAIRRLNNAINRAVMGGRGAIVYFASAVYVVLPKLTRQLGLWQGDLELPERVSKCNAEGIHATRRSMMPVKAT